MLEGISDYTILAIIVGVPSAITVPLTVWLYKIKVQGDQNHKCIEKLEKNLADHKLDLQKATNDLETKIDQLDNSVTVIKENVVESKDIHRDLKDEIKEVKEFFIDWIQRVEDLNIPRRRRSVKKSG